MPDRPRAFSPTFGSTVRVALVCDTALDFTGGAQTSTLAHARIMSSAGFRVVVVAPTPYKTVDIGTALPVWVGRPTTHALTSVPRFRNSSRLRARLRRVFEAERITVVHAHSEFGIATAARDVARELGIPFVLTVHTFFWSAPHFPCGRILGPLIGLFTHAWTGRAPNQMPLACDAIGNALRNVTLSAALDSDVVISPSAHQARALLAAGARNVLRVSNASDSGTPISTPVSEPSNVLRVLWIGRCSPEKRLLTFVEGALLALKEIPLGAMEVTVAGEGVDLEPARDVVGTTPGIHFTGLVDHAAVPDLIQQNHIVAITSDGFDNQPMVIIEALRNARGVMFVDPNLAETAGMGGVQTNTPDSKGIADTLVALSTTPNLVAQLSIGAVEEAANVSPEALLRNLFKIYRSVITGTCESSLLTAKHAIPAMRRVQSAIRALR